jgi:hypothetical protein
LTGCRIENVMDEVSASAPLSNGEPGRGQPSGPDGHGSSGWHPAGDIAESDPKATIRGRACYGNVAAQ